MRRLWITDQPMTIETDDGPVLNEVDTAPHIDVEVLFGIPLSLADVIAPGTLGYVELDGPLAEPEPPQSITAGELLATYSAARGGSMTSTTIDKGVKALIAALADALNA